MSLINDALKKAQKQRTGEMPPLASMPSVGGERPADFAPRARRASSGAPGGLFLWIGLGAGGVVVLAVAGFFLLRGKSDSPAAPVATAQPAATAPTTSTVPPPVVTQPSVTLPPAATPPAAVASVATPPPASPAPTFVLPTTPAPATTVAMPAETRPAPAPSVTTAPPVAAPVASTTAPASPAAAGRLEPRAVQYIEAIKVAGIRASATDSKVLMNDRVYRVGSMVEPEMGLRLVEITANSLTFEDERGARHTRHF